jgi:acetyl/propionyl-CoA carboxylase alpha subunit
LDEFEIGGIQTTLPFHRWLLEEPDFATGEGLSTDLVARCWDPAPVVAAAALRAAELVALDAAKRPAGMPVPDSSGQPSESAWWRAGVVEATERRP